MALTQLDNLQTELAIIIEPIQFFQDSNYYPSTYYDLRHAYAIRCRKLGVDLLDSSQLMGHDPSTHSKHYQRWIGLDDRIASLEAAIERNEVANRQEGISPELLLDPQTHGIKPIDSNAHPDFRNFEPIHQDFSLDRN